MRKLALALAALLAVAIALPTGAEAAKHKAKHASKHSAKTTKVAKVEAPKPDPNTAFMRALGDGAATLNKTYPSGPAAKKK
jgi:hypothetical protein